MRNIRLIGAGLGLALSALAFVRPVSAGTTFTPCSASNPNGPGGCGLVTNGAQSIAPAPTADARAGVAENASPVSAATLVLKASAGNAYTVSAVNLSANPGFLVVIDANAVPADGTITPIGCAPIAGSSPASLTWGQGSPPVHFTNGLVAVLTSSASCFTKQTVTSPLTGFVSGQVQ